MAVMIVQMWHFVVVALAGWINRQQQDVLAHLGQVFDHVLLLPVHSAGQHDQQELPCLQNHSSILPSHRARKQLRAAEGAPLSPRKIPSLLQIQELRGLAPDAWSAILDAGLPSATSSGASRARHGSERCSRLGRVSAGSGHRPGSLCIRPGICRRPMASVEPSKRRPVCSAADLCRKARISGIKAAGPVHSARRNTANAREMSLT